jgi:hypothetical protein
VLEHLKKVKRQSSVLLLRFITGEYYAPLGVWVVRQAVRKTLVNKPLVFDSKDLMLKYVKAMVKKKFGLDIDFLFRKSVLLAMIKAQTKLTSF